MIADAYVQPLTVNRKLHGCVVKLVWKLFCFAKDLKISVNEISHLYFILYVEIYTEKYGN